MIPSLESKVSGAIEQMTANLRTTSTEVPGVPREIAEGAALAGFQTATGTITIAGQ